MSPIETQKSQGIRSVLLVKLLRVANIINNIACKINSIAKNWRKINYKASCFFEEEKAICFKQLALKQLALKQIALSLFA
jgi:hypothetical protein